MSKSMSVYIAGPMRSIPNNNFPAFYEGERLLRAAHPNATVINPARLDAEAGFDGDHDADEGFMREAMKRDLSAICECTHLALLPFWHQSAGANAELALARALGLVIIEMHVDGTFPVSTNAEATVPPPPPETILEEAQRITSGDRDKQYGHPRAHWSRTAAAINAMFDTDFKPEDWGTCMILDKLARERNGHKRDNLVDAAGYARCIERCLEASNE